MPDFEAEAMQEIFREAAQTIEQSLALEDAGWIKLGGASGSNVLTDAERKTYVQKCRIYAVKDPLAKQSVRLWTDYTFGTGMTWATEEEAAKAAMTSFWGNPANAGVLSARGQRKSSDKALIDGEIFFALFLGGSEEAKIRRIDPLEITEIITDPDDLEDARYYKREWTDTQGKINLTYYPSFANAANKPCKDALGAEVRAEGDAPLVYHLALNTIGQRGNSLLLPVIEWIRLHRQFMGARVAIMLALARFAWKNKVKGGPAAVTATKATYEGQTPAAGAMVVENMGADMQPIRTDSNARNAYDDGRMLKLQVSSGVGIPEQYFGDLSTGNLATAKTVELPMQKMFESYQQTWEDAYNDIDQVVLEHAGVPEGKRYVDRDFPAIAPDDQNQLALSLQIIAQTFPELASKRDVLQKALMSIGISNTNEVLDDIAKESGIPVAALVRELRRFRESLKGDGHGDLSGV